MESDDDTEDLAVGEWRRHWRLGQGEVERTVETLQLMIRDDTGDLAAGE